MVAHNCNPSPWEVLTGKSWVQGQPQMHETWSWKNKNKIKTQFQSFTIKPQATEQGLMSLSPFTANRMVPFLYLGL